MINSKKSHSAHLLALAGAIPFVASTAGLWVLPRTYAMELIYPLVAYGAVILAFMGAVHWGLAITLENAGDSYRAAVVSAIASAHQRISYSVTVSERRGHKLTSCVIIVEH